MSFRTLIRILALSVALLLASPLIWHEVGPLPLLAGLALLVLTFSYLVWGSGKGDLTRWQLRYRLLPAGDQGDLDHLEDILCFLAKRTGHYVLEASAFGLVLEVREAFDPYVEAQLPRALPETKLVKDHDNEERRAAGSFFLCIGPPSSDILHWATEDQGRWVRVHLHQGPFATLVTQTDGTRPPGRWCRLPFPRLLDRLWQRPPLWDELSAGMHLSRLFPPTEGNAVHSSQSWLLGLTPPQVYQANSDGRHLGRSTDGRLLSLSHDIPLFTVGAPASFLAQQALDDLDSGRAVAFVSPHRRLLEWISHQAVGIHAHWLDPHNSHRSAHLAIANAEEWDTHGLLHDAAVAETLTFLADLGVDVDMPAVRAFCLHLIRALVSTAQHAGRDVAFIDLYAISRSTQTLRAFLLEAQSIGDRDAQELLAHIDNDAGFVQAVIVLSTIRDALEPLGAGALRDLCSPPFLNASQLMKDGGLLLIPMTNTDYREHDRLLSAMLDLILRRALATGDELQLALHLHDPHLYRDDHGQQWIDFARQNPRLSLLLDVQDPRNHVRNWMEEDGAEIIFRCSRSLASHIIDQWNLPASISDLTDLLPGTAVARLPDMTVTLKVGDQ